MSMINGRSVVAMIMAMTLAAPAWACPQGMRPARSFITYTPSVASSMIELARCVPYRAFVVYANGTDMLYLDRLHPDDNGSALVAGQGMGFAPFNTYEAARDVRTLACSVLDDGRVRISGRAYNVNSGKTFAFSLDADPHARCYAYHDTQGPSPPRHGAHAASGLPRTR